MSWSIGWDERWQRDIGYGVPSLCDHPGCDARIDRGLSYVCANQEPRGGDGCGLYFCGQHHWYYAEGNEELSMCCERCRDGQPPFPAKPDLFEWVEWKMTHESWQSWRDENEQEVGQWLELMAGKFTSLTT